MGIIGNDLLKRIKQAEADDDWDLTLELLAMAQLNAAKNYVELVRKMGEDSIDKEIKIDKP